MDDHGYHGNRSWELLVGTYSSSESFVGEAMTFLHPFDSVATAEIVEHAIRVCRPHSIGDAVDHWEKFTEELKAVKTQVRTDSTPVYSR